MTFVLAKIFGLYFLGVGIACLFNPVHFRHIYKQMLKNDGVLFLGGVIALLFGAFVVSIHNIWVMDWPVIITILGWWSLIKGVALILIAKNKVTNSSCLTRHLRAILSRPYSRIWASKR